MMRKALMLLSIVFFVGTMYGQFRNNWYAEVEIIYTLSDHVNIDVHTTELTFNLEYLGVGRGFDSGEPLWVSYDLSSLAGNKKLTAQILFNDLPDGIYLDIKSDTPPGADGMGFVTVSTSPESILENIPAGTDDTYNLYFKMRADMGAPVADRATRTVRLTVSE